MLNIVWPIFLILSIIYSILSGNLSKLNQSIFESTNTAIELSVTLIGTMALWSGIMKIASETSIVNKITNFLRPIMKILFPKMKKDDNVYKEISMNMVANILGLGNAATPFGLKAIKEMQELNKEKDRATRSMITFLVLNTASVTIMPTTIISLRMMYGSLNPEKIIPYIIITSSLSCLVGLILDRIFYMVMKR